jgi:predicted aldo/keto reductase-like oxidoreductase
MMTYRAMGATGERISSLGFGCMRLPMKNATTVDREKAIPMLQHAWELGVNYFDTGKNYCAGDSERVLGEALKGMQRSRVYVATKYAEGKASASDLREKFEASLRLLDVEYVDFYHFWGISWRHFREKLSVPGGPLEAFLRLKEEGLVRHLSFSFHSEPGDIVKLVDTGYFESMLCQYNFLDRRCEEGIAYASSKGLGVAVMGPVGGGRLSAHSDVIARMLPGQRAVSTPELALRFVLSNPGVSVALSGMSTVEQVEQNAATASREAFLTARERDLLLRRAGENQRFMDLYCTGCGYCMPCPHEVNIPRIFEAMNLSRVWGLHDAARRMYDEIGTNPWVRGKKADACAECGECEQKCPQKIPVIAQLAQSRKALERAAG